MNICLMSYMQDSPGAGGGCYSTRGLVEALKKLNHNITLVNSPKEIGKTNTDIVLHQNIRELVRTQRVCEREGLPLVVTLNGFISCCVGLHIVNETKYGKPCHRCSLFGVFRCLLGDRCNQYSPLRKTFFNALTTPLRYHFLKKKIAALDKADKIVCIGKSMKEILRTAGLSSEMDVIPQPIDQSIFIKPKARIFDERIALFVGGITWKKGAHLAAEAVSKLEKTKLILVGRLPREKMIRQIKKTLGERAIFTGPVHHSEIKKYYYSSHVTLYPTLHLDPFGRTWAESSACGVPVVGFNGRGGVSDHLTHEKNCLLSNYDVDEYTKQVQRLFDDEKLYKKISKNGREYAKKNFLAESVAKRYEDVFEEVLNERDGNKQME